MASIVDSSPFPFSNPDAQALRNTLADLYPSPQQARRLADDAGLPPGTVLWEQPAIDLWHTVLRELAAHLGSTRTLIQNIHDLLPPSHPRRPIFARVLQGQAAEVDAQPRGPNGEAGFLVGTDDIPQPEALLYYDDLTFSTGRIPGLITTLERLLSLAPAVCRMEVRIGATSQNGTGFRVGDDLLLTNWHVVHSRAGVPASTINAEFGYEDDPTGKLLTGTAVTCDATPVASSEDDDWALIRATQPLLKEWPVIRLADAVPPTLNTSAFIIQHPQGARKRFGFVRNQVTNFTDRVVHYLTDTQEGSSGAPVFDEASRLIALHHAGGRPQDVAGKQPVKKNEGIRISRVLAGLTGQGIALP